MGVLAAAVLQAWAKSRSPPSTRTEIQAARLAERIDDAAYLAIARDARAILADYVDAQGAVRLPIRARFIAGRRQ